MQDGNGDLRGNERDHLEEFSRIISCIKTKADEATVIRRDGNTLVGDFSRLLALTGGLPSFCPRLSFQGCLLSTQLGRQKRRLPARQRADLFTAQIKRGGLELEQAVD